MITLSSIELEFAEKFFMQYYNFTFLELKSNSLLFNRLLKIKNGTLTGLSCNISVITFISIWKCFYDQLYNIRIQYSINDMTPYRKVLYDMKVLLNNFDEYYIKYQKTNAENIITKEKIELSKQVKNRQDSFLNYNNNRKKVENIYE